MTSTKPRWLCTQAAISLLATGYLPAAFFSRRLPCQYRFFARWPPSIIAECRYAI